LTLLSGLLTLILAAIICFVVTWATQFEVDMIVLPTLFFGAIACIILWGIRAERERESPDVHPRRRLTRSDFWRFVGIGASILVCTLVVLPIGTFLFH